MIVKTIVYSLLVALISYEFSIYLNPREYTALVHTVNGKVRGIISESRGGRRFGAFWGIPFAAPPVGTLRFEAPQPIENWTEIYIADKEEIECIHVDFILDLGVKGVEDCLTINVFTPNKDLVEIDDGSGSSKEKVLLPVIVYIYGGGFMSGSSKKFKAGYFMDEDVILVTFNYRLGALGFLNTGDNAVKGNMGLKDQVMALRWVRDNIERFGGNPNQVTLMGESAGGVSVHMHMLSSLSKGLFQKAISLSGHALVPWAVVKNPARQAQLLGEHLNCPTIMSSDFLDCLRRIDARDIAILHRVNRFPLVDPLEGYGPTIETTVDSETFLSKMPGEILKSNDYTKVPWITGVNEGEGLLWVARILLDTEVVENVKNINEWYKAARRFLYFDDNFNLEAVKRITQFYFEFGKEEPTDFDLLSKVVNISNLISDRVFNVNLHKLVESYQDKIGNQENKLNSSKSLNAKAEILKSKLEAPLYLYYYTYKGEFKMFNVAMAVPTNRIFASQFYMAYALIKDWILNAIIGITPGSDLPACHADEVALLFNLGLGLNIGKGAKDYAVSVELVKMVSEFATNERPELQFFGKTWTPAQSGSSEGIQLMTLDVQERSGLTSLPFKERIKFWDTLNWDI